MAAGAAHETCAPLFEAGTDRNAFDRVLLAWAVHPDGPAFTRAHLLLWESTLQCLEGRIAWHAPDPELVPSSLASALRQASLGTDVEGTRALRGLSLDPGRLEPVLADAWGARGTSQGNGSEPARPWSGAGAIGVVRIGDGPHPYALLVGEWADGGEAPAHARALTAYRSVVERALRGLERADELERRRRQARALLQATPGLGGPGHLAEAVHALVTAAQDGCQARGAALWRRESGAALRLEGVAGASGPRERLGQGLIPLATSVCESGHTLVLDQAGEREDLVPETAASISAVALVPVRSGGVVTAVIGVYDRMALHPADGVAFEALDVGFLETLAAIAGGVLQRATSDEALRAGRREREELVRRVRRLERDAEGGTLAWRALREARNPVASIAAFARRAHRNLPEEDGNREYLEVILRESARLEAWVERGDSGPEPEPEGVRMADLNAIVQAALHEAGERLVRRRVRLLKRLATGLPTLLIDTGRIGRAIHNLLDQALEAVRPGGRVRVETRRSGSHVVIEIAHDGHAEGGERFEQLLAAFAGGRGAPVGLAIAERIVREHGGEVRVRGEGEWGAILTLALPVRENGDRRATSPDRRRARDRRTQTTAA
jgi:signal transduction histidine kinase